MAEAEREDISLIDMVAVNLYPFEVTISKEGVELEEAIENIDIGGPTLLRSAAKTIVRLQHSQTHRTMGVSSKNFAQQE